MKPAHSLFFFYLKKMARNCRCNRTNLQHANVPPNVQQGCKKAKCDLEELKSLSLKVESFLTYRVLKEGGSCGG